ncbi:MAG: hypothetical protein Q613_PSC00338G0001, partial [Propionibacterium sp. DORA_15]
LHDLQPQDLRAGHQDHIRELLRYRGAGEEG